VDDGHHLPRCGMRIPVQPPFPWERLLRYLSVRSTPGLESVTADRYVRHGTAEVTFDSVRNELECPEEYAARVIRLFDASHNPRAVDAFLRKAKLPVFPGVRVPGCWNSFELCLRVIIGQQVSVKGAHTLMGRLAARCPTLLAEEVATADLSAIGIPGRRVQTLQILAERVAAGDIQFDAAWPDVAEQLRRVPGFGPWTLGYLGIRLGRDPDAFPEQDLGLIRAAGASSPRDLLRIAERWRPWRAYAAMCLWMGE